MSPRPKSLLQNSVLLVLANAASPALAQIRRSHHGRRAGPRTHRRHRPAHRRRPRRRLGRVPRLDAAGQALVQRREPRAAPGAGPEHRRGGGLRDPPQHRHPRLGHGPQHQDRGHGGRGADRAGAVRRPGRVLLPAHPAHVGRRGQQGPGRDQVRSADRRGCHQHALGADPGRDGPCRRQARPARRQLRHVPRPRSRSAGTSRRGAPTTWGSASRRCRRAARASRSSTRAATRASRSRTTWPRSRCGRRRVRTRRSRSS